MIEYAYYNGVYTPYDATAVPLSDRSIFFSEAVYDVILGGDGIPYQTDEHFDRLITNAERIGLDSIPTKSELYEVLDRLLTESCADDFLIYIQLSGNGERRNHARCKSGANLLVTVTECKAPSELECIRAITLPDHRHDFCNIKTTCLLPAILSIEEAERQGADIAIFHKNNVVTECSHANVSIMLDGAVITHPLDSDILPGITQRNLERACGKLGIQNICRKFTTDELFSADAVMITSTTKLIKICDNIDGKALEASGLDTVKSLFNELKRDFLEKTAKIR